MLKLFYVIFMNLHRAPYMIPRMRAEADHPQRYTEEQRYSLVQHAIYLMNKTGKINTVETGAENLPKQGGYMMYPNHQTDQSAECAQVFTMRCRMKALWLWWNL